MKQESIVITADWLIKVKKQVRLEVTKPDILSVGGSCGLLGEINIQWDKSTCDCVPSAVRFQRKVVGWRVGIPSELGSKQLQTHSRGSDLGSVYQSRLPLAWGADAIRDNVVVFYSPPHPHPPTPPTCSEYGNNDFPRWPPKSPTSTHSCRIKI